MSAVVPVTLLFHDNLVASATSASIATLTGLQNALPNATASKNFGLKHFHLGGPQAPVAVLEIAAGSGNVTLWVTAVGIDDRCVNQRAQLRIDATRGGGVVLAHGSFGVSFRRIQAVYASHKSGTFVSGDRCMVGFDLQAASPLVLLGSGIYRQASEGAPLSKVAGGDFSLESRHLRWTGGSKPNGTTARSIVLDPPDQEPS